MAYSNDKKNNTGHRYSDYEDELWDDEITLGDSDDDIGDDESESFSDEKGSADSEDDRYIESEGEDESGESAPSEDVASTPKPRRRMFGLGKHSDSDEDNDYFDSETDTDPEPKKEKKSTVLDPENPDYWIEDEPQIPSIIPKGRKKWKWWLAAALVPLVLVLACWVWMFVPYVDGAVRYGYLLHMERRGNVVKTFEGEMVPYREIDEVGPVHFEKLRFSVADDTTAAKMKAMMLRCVPVRIEYKVYHTSLPWRGEEKTVVVKADSADVARILPPEFHRPGEDKK